MTRSLTWIAIASLATTSAQAALHGLEISPTPEGFTLRLPVSGLPEVFALSDPPRLVVDVPVASALPDAPGLHTVPVARFGITTFRTSQFGSDPSAPVTRLVFELAKTPLWELRQRQGSIELSVATGVPGIGAPVVVGRAPEDRAPEDDPVAASAASSEPVPFERTTDASATLDEVKDALDRNIGDPSREVVDQRQSRLWQRRAEELLAMAEVDWAAGNYRDGLESLHRVFEYYPSGEHVRRAHQLAATFLCELHMGRDAADHFVALFDDPDASDSLLTIAARTLVECPLEPASGPDLLRSLDRIRERISDTDLVSRVAAGIGMLLAEGGGDIPRATELLSERIAQNPDGPEAARLHRALARCRERDGAFLQAADQYLFAARLLRGVDAEESLRDRSRAADNFFQGGDVERALEQYRVVAGVSEVPAELRSWALFQQANCFYRTRRYGEATDAYETLRGTFPDSYWSNQAAIRLAVLEESGLAGS